MKKILLLSTLLFLIFGIAAGAQALLIEVGSFDKSETPYPNSPLDALTSPYIDTAANLNVLIGDYNDNYDPDLPFISGDYVEKESPGDFPDDWTSGTISLSPGYTYISLKYDNFVDLWYILGEAEIDFDVSKGLSHYRLWNPNPVPEPATMLLLGAGLVGLAGLGRKKK